MRFVRFSFFIGKNRILEEFVSKWFGRSNICYYALKLMILVMNAVYFIHNIGQRLLIPHQKLRAYSVTLAIF